MNNLNFSFDGNFLTAELSSNADIIKYHLEMITHTAIKYILPVRKQSVNNNTYLYFEVVGKTPLDRMVMYKKLSENAYMVFVKGVLSAVQEISEYQLPSSGLVLDSRYIFVHPSSFEPSFAYIPIASNMDGTADVVSFLKNMLVSDMVDIQNGIVMQQVIGVLNSGKSVGEMLAALSNADSSASSGGASFTPPPVPTPSPAPVPTPSPSPAPVPTPVQERYRGSYIPAGGGAIPSNGQNRQGGVTSPVKNKPDNRKKAAAEAPAGVEGAPDMKRIRPIMIGAGVAIAIIFLALVASGTFNDENGKTDVAVFIALPIIIAAVDYFVYHNLKTKFVITGGAVADSGKKQSTNIPQKEVYVPVKEVKVPGVNPAPAPAPTPTPTPTPAPTPTPLPVSSASLYDFSDSGETEMMDDSVGSPCLVATNGSRIELNRAITRIGRLKDQVDICLQNPRVSRVHADIIMRDGKIYVIDLGSSRGTYVNGNNKITSNMEYELHNNDTVVFADEEYTVRC